MIINNKVTIIEIMAIMLKTSFHPYISDTVTKGAFAQTPPVYPAKSIIEIATPKYLSGKHFLASCKSPK